jgi:L-ribulokinase
MKDKFSIGIDFGTESGRVVIVDVKNGNEVSSQIYKYQNGVIRNKLPNTNIYLEPDWALQDPKDYLNILKYAVPEALVQGGINPKDIIGIGIDFTSSTLLPVRVDGTPLCFLPEWKDHPHAWVKLWNHHAAQAEANMINEIVRNIDIALLNRYGGKINSEWFFPKLLQILNEDPSLYTAADRIIEAGDWIVWQMTGIETRNDCAAGYKAFYSKRKGFPQSEFFAKLHPRLEDVIDQKMIRKITPHWHQAGTLSEKFAKWIGLPPGIPVAAANVDAHSAVLGAGVSRPNIMVIIMGTSNCHMIMSKNEYIVPGICGCVEDGILPGFFGYEAGQPCVGDLFAWFIENQVPEKYTKEAKERNIDIYKLLEIKASSLKVGENGILALDWWNGNRSILADADLSGLLIGLTLTTKPEEIYRGLIEATAYGTRKIIQSFEDNGIHVDEIVACGGLPDKNELLMKIYADVTCREIKLAKSSQTSALGAAIYGAFISGKEQCGYSSLTDAIQSMAHMKNISYKPDKNNMIIYDNIFKEFEKLHDYFGRQYNDVMKKLKSIRLNVR